jgi:hypothetical protein
LKPRNQLNLRGSFAESQLNRIKNKTFKILADESVKKQENNNPFSKQALFFLNIG